MTYLQFQELFNDEIQGRWEKWVPSQATITDWWEEMRYYTSDAALAAIKSHKKSHKAINAEPKIAEVISLLYKNKREGASSAVLQDTLFCYFQCLDPPVDHPEWLNRLWPAIIPCRWTDVDKANESLAAQLDTLVKANSGRWGSVVSHSSLIPDDGLTGPEAAKQARVAVLDGPDTPGRMVLVSLAAGEAVPFLGSTLEDIPF